MALEDECWDVPTVRVIYSYEKSMGKDTWAKYSSHELYDEEFDTLVGEPPQELQRFGSTYLQILKTVDTHLKQYDCACYPNSRLRSIFYDGFGDRMPQAVIEQAFSKVLSRPQLNKLQINQDS